MNYLDFKKIVFVLMLYLNAGQAQSFFSVGGGTNNLIESLFADTANNFLYAGGYFTEAGNAPCKTIARWNGTVWDSLNNNITGSARTINKFNNELYAGNGLGIFDSSGQWIVSGLIKWDSITHTWIIPDTSLNGNVFGTLNYNNNLYIMGNFDSIGGIYSPKIAQYDGINWYGLPPLDTSTGGYALIDAIFYNGDLYVGGNFDSQLSPFMQDIAKWDGTQWLPVSYGLSGPLSWIKDFTIYNGRLIVGGYFKTIWGDPGNGIAAWNGSQWSQLSSGVSGSSQVEALAVYNGELWVGGAFTSAGGVPAMYLAKWDGTQWYNAGINLNGSVTAMAVLGNDLYIAGNFIAYLNADTSKCIIRYNYLTGFETLDVPKENVEIYPNPVPNILHIQSSKDFTATGINLYDTEGRKATNKKFNKNTSLSVSQLNGGIYFYEITDVKGKVKRGKLVKL